MDKKPTKRMTLEQGRAAKAYRFAEAGAKLSKKKEYKSYVKKLPMLIKTNGLGAAMAFIFAKGSKNGLPKTSEPWGLIYSQIEEWLMEDEKCKRNLIKVEKNRLAYSLTLMDSYTYRAVTIEVLALLTWVRRFAEALIAGEADQN